MNFSFRTKTITGTALIEATLLLVLIITSLSFMTQLAESDLQKRAKTTVNLFASITKDPILTMDLASLQASVEELLSNPDIAYAKVIDSQQRVLAQAGRLSLLERSFRPDANIKNVDDSIFDTEKEIVIAGQHYGVVRIGIDVTSTQSSLNSIETWIISLAILELVMVALFSYGLGTFLTSRLRVLRQGARDMAHAIPTQSYQDISVDVAGNDELTEVAASFNKMVSALADENHSRNTAEAELKSLNASLEQIVNERTQALSIKNQQLESSNKELKETQQLLFQAEKMASVGQLAAGVAHEINNPVGFVSSNLSTLKDYLSVLQILLELVKKLNPDDDLPGLQQKLNEIQDFYSQHDLDFITEDIPPLLEESSEGLSRVSEIVKGLKIFSRIDAEELQWYDLNHCLNTTLTMVNNKLKYVCKVEKHLGELPVVYFNLGKLTQVFTNLLMNAGQAIETTGKQGVIKITTQRSGQLVTIKIEDDGCGIDPQHLEKLFNPFFTTKPEGQGTGLGLSISYGIIQEHGGKIEVSSEVGVGSQFVITLPINGPETENQHDISPDAGQ